MLRVRREVVGQRRCHKTDRPRKLAGVAVVTGAGTGSVSALAVSKLSTAKSGTSRKRAQSGARKGHGSSREQTQVAGQLVLANAKGSTSGAPAARTTRAAIVSVHPLSDRSSTSSTGPPVAAMTVGSGASHNPFSAATR